MRRCLSLLPALVLLACNGSARENMRNEQPGTLDAPARTPDVIFVPTRMEVVEQMLTLARVDSNDLVYDLGSGDGRIVITAASRRGARGVGIDIDPQRIRESLANRDSAGVQNRVEFRQADLFRTDLRSATAVTLYLLPSLNVKLRPKLFSELRPGTPVVSNSFEMGDWEPDSTVSMNERFVYLWVIPANASGTWQFDDGTGTQQTLQFTQRYQKLSGTVGARSGANNRTSADTITGQLRGDTITFSMNAGGQTVQFAGTVNGSTMTGMSRNGQAASWRATRTGAAGSPLPMERFR